jgi:phage-related protein
LILRCDAFVDEDGAVRSFLWSCEDGCYGVADG